jgi:hypothetical protein
MKLMTRHKVFAEFVAIYVVFLIQVFTKREYLLPRRILNFIFVSCTDAMLSNLNRYLNDVEYCISSFVRSVDTSAYMGASLLYL